VTIILTTLAVGWLGLMLVLFLIQDRMLFFPSRELVWTPSRADLAYEDLMLPLEDGNQVSAWFVPAKNARGTVLFCHGNAGNISHRLESIRDFHELGVNVLIFDYEGYGRSTGKPSEAALYRDVRAVWSYLTKDRGLPPERIVLFGRSLGGAVAAWLAARVDAAGLIVESSFTSVPDMARELYPLLTIRAMVRTRLETATYVQQVRCPVLVAHSRDDDIVPYSHGRRIYELAPEPKFFLEMRGDHNSGPFATGPAYREGLGRFLDEVLPR
jgi:fermentation-respiration switch protein FrsA (DUF1100 family)